MVPVFSKLSGSDLTPERIAEHINRLQDEISACFMNISSDNIESLSLNETHLASNGGSYLLGDEINMVSPVGESFFAGINKETGQFEFHLRGKTGEYLILYTNGVLTIKE